MLKSKLQAPITIIFTFLIFTIIFLVSINYYNNIITNDIQIFLKETNRVERNFVDGIPIFEDFTSAEKERIMRKFLLKDHLKTAIKYNITPIKDDTDIEALLKEKKIVKLKSDTSQLYYFYNVRDKYRYLTPDGVAGLNKITARFQENLLKRGVFSPVKIALSSVIRPGEYQRDLSKKNINAAIESTHLYGVSFDIFHDDYYVSLPETASHFEASRDLLMDMRRRFGFLIGDSLRRQFRTVLMETLIQLQDEGVLYAILENKQRCYHITIIKH